MSSVDQLREIADLLARAKAKATVAELSPYTQRTICDALRNVREDLLDEEYQAGVHTTNQEED